MSEVFQHLPDIIIPVIEITEGWAAKDCSSREECEDAFAYLMSACAQIEYQIDMELTKPKTHWNEVWLAKARCALKFKKAALQIVQQKRSVIAQAERVTRDTRLLEIIRCSVSDQQFRTWLVALGQPSNSVRDEAA